MNVDKLLALDWEPEYTHAEAIRQTVRWYVENRWWWEPIRSGEFKEYYQRLYGSRQVLQDSLKRPRHEGSKEHERKAWAVQALRGPPKRL